jgi:hypothetical protein
VSKGPETREKIVKKIKTAKHNLEEAQDMAREAGDKAGGSSLQEAIEKVEEKKQEFENL